MTPNKTRKWYKRREVYLVAGIAIGIVVMTMPALVHTMMGTVSPFMLPPATEDTFVHRGTLASIDILAEVMWLALPAIFLILALWWVAGRRQRWKGYDEAVKWTRR